MTPPRPRIEFDPLTGRPVLVAPHRRLRPQDTHARSPGTCPFCPGQEAETPPEVDAIRAPDSLPDRPGWRMRAFANLFPATDAHEVVAEGPEHLTQPAALGQDAWREALVLHARRIAALEARPDTRIAFWFKNVGAAAGASLAHNHSQILGLPMLPPRLELIGARVRAAPACPYCQEVASAAADGRVIWEDPRFVVLSPRTPKLPYETWLLPKDHDEDFLAAAFQPELGGAVHRLYLAVQRAFGEPAFNVYLHRLPERGLHWHYELQPRTGQVAGLELGGDMYINAVLAAESAERLRRALAGG
ncbi:MAG: hypothetical protein IT458_02845 [Planctomycetes bacterium]|nr:hypothetical protein [Planctomycetota bacterium]